MRQLWLLVIVVACAGVSVAQFPPCFRSKFTNDWPIRVAHVDLQDGDKLSRREKSTVIRELRRQCDCWPCALSSDVSDQIREIYQWYGYFQAVADVDVKKTGIDTYSVTARVQEGPQYRLGDISFSNIKAFSPAELRALFQLAPGDLFDTRPFRRGLEKLWQAYANKGHLNFSAVPDTRIDTDAGTISIRIDVEEGKAFRLGSLLLAGNEPPRGFGKKLQDDWRPHQGEVYNSDFVDNFIIQHLSGMNPRITYIQDAAAGTVAVRVEFK
jgi:outer membrane protein assembly factor BamA